MTSVIKLQSPFEKIKKITNTAPEIALRRAIILQAVIDASNLSNNKTAKKIEKEAKIWLFGNSNYFRQICEEAELNVKSIIDMAHDLISLNKIRNEKSCGN